MMQFSVFPDRLTLLWLAAVLLFATLAWQDSPVEAQPIKTPRPKVVAYVPNWIDLEAFTPTIDYAKITHLNLAFENPTDPSGNLSFNPQNQVLIRKAHQQRIPVLISIGGGAASTDKALLALYAKLLSGTKRAGFIAQLSTYITQHDFDGLDVDLEGPAIDDNYGAFIRELTRVLRPQGKLLTAALSQGYGGTQVPDSVFADLDWINIMAYDATGYWNPDAPGQHSSLEFAHQTVDYWLGRGLTKRKAILGVPFYGYGFGTAFRKREYPYSAIVAAYAGAEQADRVGETIWYNGMPTMKAKARYVREEGLGGMMIWSLDSDAPGEHSLLAALHQDLNP